MRDVRKEWLDTMEDVIKRIREAEEPEEILALLIYITHENTLFYSAVEVYCDD